MIVINKILKFLLPPVCPICYTQVDEPFNLCATCYSKLKFINSPTCSICGKPILSEGQKICAECLQKKPSFHKSISALKYNETSKSLILPFKHADHTELIHLLCKFMIQKGDNLLKQNDIFIPVPLHWKRLYHRKYNQSSLLAQNLAKKYHKIYQPNVLVRIKDTKSQGHLSANQRKKNVKNAFRIKNPQLIKGQKILLIDDVYTTGSTVNECAKALIHSGAKQVDVLCLCRAIRD